MTVTNFYNEGGTYNEITINGDGAVINTCEIKDLEEQSKSSHALCDALVPYFDDENNAKAVSELASVTKPSMLTVLLKRWVNEKKITRTLVFDHDFLSTITPLLGYKPELNTVKKHLNRTFS